MDSKTIARAAAEYAHNAYFSSRRGTLPSDGHLTVIYDNNPMQDGHDARYQVLTDLKAVIAEHGILCDGEASYPEGGELDGYTIAMVFVTPDSDLVSQVWKRLLLSTIQSHT